MKIALVYDRVNKFGGAERILLALHKIWPDAPLYTTVYDPKGAPWARGIRIVPSFLQNVPFARTNHELFPWVTPLSFEVFSFDAYDVVISITSAEAKTIITKPETLHICYCLTPTRYLWSGQATYEKNPGLGRWNRLSRWVFRWVRSTLQRWDLIASTRPDYFLAISSTVKGRVETYYQRNVHDVIVPPIDLTLFHPGKEADVRPYFLCVSRLVGYKRIDIVIDAFNKIGWPLIVIGQGRERDTLKRRAKSNITFIDHNLTDQEIALYYQQCRAFVFAGEEDFGLVAAEAQACGRPVIAYNKGGVAEVILDGKTGIVFNEQSAESLLGALDRFGNMTIDSDSCRNNARRFDEVRFRNVFARTVVRLWEEYHSI